MTNTNKPAEPLAIADVTAVDYLAGYLYGEIKARGSISVEAWNAAITSSLEYGERQRVRAEARADKAKANAMAARRRGAGA